MPRIRGNILLYAIVKKNVVPGMDEGTASRIIFKRIYSLPVFLALEAVRNMEGEGPEEDTLSPSTKESSSKH
jgi:hypothetical protein